MAIELGAKVKETISGFAGTVTARCEYLADNSNESGVSRVRCGG